MPKALPVAALLTLLLPPATEAQRRDAFGEAEAVYHRALADLAAGSMALAIARVAGLEEEDTEECVQAVELGTAERLAELEPEALLPLAFLRVAVVRHRSMGRGVSSGLHGFERVSLPALRRLGELYAASSRRDEARSLVGGLLVYTARDVSSPRSEPRLAAAVELLEAALDHDPESQPTLHWLAVTYELMGRPEAALEPLDRLLALDPANASARLRRAVVTVKSRRRERGLELLAELTTAGPTWVRDLATQEHARLLVAAGREEEAETLLRRALDELPREKLSLQLAALLDPRWAESWQALGPVLAAPPGDAGPSARWRYDKGPEEELEALRLELNRAVSSRLAALGSGLDLLPAIWDPARDLRAACR